MKYQQLFIPLVILACACSDPPGDVIGTSAAPDEHAADLAELEILAAADAQGDAPIDAGALDSDAVPVEPDTAAQTADMPVEADVAAQTDDGPVEADAEGETDEVSVDASTADEGISAIAEPPLDVEEKEDGELPGAPDVSPPVCKPGAKACDDAGELVCKDDGSGWAEISCQDDNVCTTESCVGGVGCVHLPVAGTCTDGSVCTIGDYCVGGQCKGNAIACKDLDPCTDDLCEATKGCTFPFNAAPCDDGDPCTTADACKQGNCQGSMPSCEDGDACTLNTCDPNKGCAFPPDPAACDDQDACTQDACQGPIGMCNHKPVPGCCTGPGACDDGVACTTDACVNHACVHVAVSEGCCKINQDCDDARLCTTDACGPQGICTHAPVSGTQAPVWSVTWDKGADGFAQSGGGDKWVWSQTSAVSHDGGGAYRYGPATGAPFTNLQTSYNAGAYGPTITLPPGAGFEFDLWCKVDVTPGLAQVKVHASSSQGGYVLVKSTYSQGWQKLHGDLSPFAGQVLKLSVHGAVTPVSGKAAAGTGIYLDSLTIRPKCPVPTCATGCRNYQCFTNSCSDLGECRWGPTCVLKDECNDSNPCTKDTWNGSSCSHQAIPSCCTSDATCADTDTCTLDRCNMNVCEHIAMTGCCNGHTACADKDPCTVDTCNGDHACSHAASCCTKNEQCNDGESACTTDACVDGACQHVPTGASTCCPPAPWSEGFNETLIGWTFTNSSGSATKGWQASSAPGKSHSGPGLLYYGDSAKNNYDFGTSAGTAQSPTFALPSTVGLAVAFWIHADIEADPAYDKLQLSVISAGTTTKIWEKTGTGWTAKEWRRASANLAPWQGKSVQLEWSFDTVDSTANTGLGVRIDDIEIVPCFDGNPCTDDTCVPGKGCVFTQNTGTCNDDSPCTTDDVCLAGKCVGKPKACQGTNPCVPGVCDPANGSCIGIKPTGTPCTESTACSIGIGCGGGVCVGKPLDCDDGNPCTSDSCSGSGTYTSCKHVLNTTCCVAQTYAQLFEQADAVGWELDSLKSGTGWQVWSQASHAFSGTGALYFGNPVTGGYAGSYGGTAVSPPIAIPTNKISTLSLQLYMDTEADLAYDKLTIRLLIGGYEKATLFDKAAIGFQTGEWVNVQAKVSGYGSPIQIEFEFNTMDGLENQTSGVFVDDVQVLAKCAN